MSQTSPKVNWDYTEHAAHYDKRADYSYDAIKQLLTATGCTPQKPIAEVGAGTGKLTKELLKHGLAVKSVEPNDDGGDRHQEHARPVRHLVGGHASQPDCRAAVPTRCSSGALSTWSTRKPR